jgi:hypothetical protein
MACFAEDLQRDKLDREPFTFHHKLLGHPALTLENLGRMIPTLPKSQVHWSKGSLQRSDDFIKAARLHSNGLTIEETIETIRTSDSYIMIRQPHTDATFSPLFAELLRDVEGLMEARNVGRKAHGASLYLFISSPHSVTPFHIDRFSNFLMQFQGTKELCVFPQWDERVMQHDVRESIVADSGARAMWQPEAEPLGRSFHLEAGDALHIPFVAGHHVRNGPEVSISLSMFFNTDETHAQRNAMEWNDRLRRKFGYRSSPVGPLAARDRIKAGAFRAAQRVSQALGR